MILSSVLCAECLEILSYLVWLGAAAREPETPESPRPDHHTGGGRELWERKNKGNKEKVRSRWGVGGERVTGVMLEMELEEIFFKKEIRNGIEVTIKVKLSKTTSYTIRTLKHITFNLNI